MFKRHPNGGGLVEDTATVSDAAIVEKYAKIIDNAIVMGNYDKKVVVIIFLLGNSTCIFNTGYYFWSV